MKKIPEAKRSLLVVAGEVSGDQLFAAILNKSKLKHNIHFFGCGGEKMKKEGVQILYDIHKMEVIGLSEIILKYLQLRSIFHTLIQEAQHQNILDALLIDYPGFNLYLAKKLSKLGINCHFIVSPQIWAWNFKRIHKIKKYIKNVLCLYEFETKIYKKYDISSYLMGHPLAYEIRSKTPNLQKNVKREPETKYICLLPGSRKREIDRMFPFMLSLCREFQETYNNSDIKFLLPCPQNKELINKIETYMLKYPKFIELMPGKVHEALAKSHVAIACSGTVTLECFLSKVPFLLLYATSWTTYWIGRHFLVKSRYLGIVNIIQNSTIHQEFIQSDVKKKKVMPELTKLVFDEDYRANMLENFENILQKIPQDDPAKRAGEIIENIIDSY